MNLKFIEACQSEHGPNWGKFAIGRFTAEEWAQRSSLPGESPGSSLIAGRGWSPEHILFLDLQTGEGAILRPGGYAHADLEKHKIWICPMAEPFIEWLYGQDLSDLDALPGFVELPDAPFDMQGYRRPGKL